MLRQVDVGIQCNLLDRVEVVIQLSPIMRMKRGVLLSCNSRTSKRDGLKDAFHREQQSVQNALQTMLTPTHHIGG